MYRLRGLGQTYKQTSDGTVVDCDLVSNMLYGVCWNPFSPVIPDSAVPSNNPVPQPVPPPAPVATPDNPQPLTLPPSSGAGATGTINATLEQGIQNNQTALQNFIQSLQNQGACPMTLMPSLGICDSWVYVGGIGVAALFAVILFGGRR